MPAEHIVNAVISAAGIRVERGFFLTSWLDLDYGGAGQGYGGFVLGGLPGTEAGKHAEQANIAAEWIAGVMRAAGVDSWADLPGKPLRVKLSSPGLAGRIEAIGHFIHEDRWFDGREAMARLAVKPREQEAARG